MVEAVGVFFVGLAVWEFIVLGILAIALGVSLNYESSLGFAVIMAIFIAVGWGTAGSVWSTITLGGLIWGGAVYVVIGIVWSFYKWKLLVADTIEDAKAKSYIKSKQDLKDLINRNKNYDVIGFWIIVWPLSVIGYLIYDFVVDMVKGLIDRLYTVYDRITDSLIGNSAFANLKDDENEKGI